MQVLTANNTKESHKTSVVPVPPSGEMCKKRSKKFMIFPPSQIFAESFGIFHGTITLVPV